MAYNYDKLNGKIIEKFKTRNNFATAFGITANTLSKKLNSSSDWSQHEIIRACTLLEITQSEILDYFFCYKS